MMETALSWSKKVYLPSRKASKPLPNTHAYEDPRTGFRSVVTVDPVTNDIIVAFRGMSPVDSPQSAASSLSLNYPQFESVEFTKTLRKVRQLMRAQGHKSNVIVTGHSSGGGLAEAFSYRLLEETPERHRANINVNLFTWNGIGSIEWFKQRDKSFVPDPKLVEKINGTHLRAEHDIVSQFGRRFTGVEWTWSHEKTNFVKAHVIPENLTYLHEQGLAKTKVAQRLKFLTGPAATRFVFLGASNALIGTMNTCRALLGLSELKVKKK